MNKETTIRVDGKLYQRIAQFGNRSRRIVHKIRRKYQRRPKHIKADLE